MMALFTDSYTTLGLDELNLTYLYIILSFPY